MEMLVMSVNDRRRLEVFRRMRGGELSLVKVSKLLRLRYRQTRRLHARYKHEGDAGVVHRLRGRSSNRQTDNGRSEEGASGAS